MNIRRTKKEFKKLLKSCGFLRKGGCFETDTSWGSVAYAYRNAPKGKPCYSFVLESNCTQVSVSSHTLLKDGTFWCQHVCSLPYRGFTREEVLEYVD